LDEQNKRVKTDGLDAKALCLKLDRYVEGNREAMATVRVPSEEEEQRRAIQIAALATVRCTDRSKSRWKPNPTSQRKRKRSEEPLTTHSPKQMN
jgi:hypothetical protein